jgi:hypothetical protein
MSRRATASPRRPLEAARGDRRRHDPPIKEDDVPRSQISSATLGKDQFGDLVKVVGPLSVGPDEAMVEPLAIYVVLVQVDAYAHGREVKGTLRVDPGLGWTVEARLGGTGVFAQGVPALAHGIIVSVDKGVAGDVPIPQVFTWTEQVVIS